MNIGWACRNVNHYDVSIKDPFRALGLDTHASQINISCIGEIFKHFIDVISIDTASAFDTILLNCILNHPRRLYIGTKSRTVASS